MATAGQQLVKEITKRPFVGVVSFSMSTAIAVALYATALSVFFFTVTAYVEKLAVQKNTDRIVRSLMRDATLHMEPEAKASIKEQLKQVSFDDMSKVDAGVAKSNKALVDKTAVFITKAVAIIAVVILFVYLMMRLGKRYTGGYPPLGSILTENLALLVFIVLAETAFAFLIGLNWRSIDENEVKLGIVDTYIKFITGG